MDHRTWTLLLNTLLVSGGACAIGVPLGTAMVWLLVRCDVPGRRLGVALLAMMLFVPLYVQAAAWQAGFGTLGWFTQGWDAPAWLVLEGRFGAAWIHAAAAVPWVALIVAVGLRMIEPELEEQALLDGSARRVFFRVTLPGTLPAVGVATLWVATTTAGEMTVTDLLAVRTYAEEIYTQAQLRRDLGEAAWDTMPGMVFTAVLVAVAAWLCLKLAPGKRPVTLGGRWTYRLEAWRWPMAAAAALVLLLLIGTAIGSLCHKAGAVVTLQDNVWLRSWSLGKMFATVAASPWRFRDEFGWSLLIASVAATAALVVAVALGWVARRGGWRALPALIVTAVCLAVPGPVVGLVVIRLLNHPSNRVLNWLYTNSILAPGMVLFVAALPLATLIVWHALRTVPQELLDAAAADGAGPIARLWRVALPCRLPAMGLAWLVALAVGLGELGGSVLVSVPGVTMLSEKIFDMLHSARDDRLAGICLSLILLFAATTAAATWLVQRWARPGADGGV
ncbi:MAG: iron ABC transporter permease [Candidatus Nealsonbacteria bacterium]|nr:iron ABC transporter permease [Candidatus Nealsonbacteria bacterium]